MKVSDLSFEQQQSPWYIKPSEKENYLNMMSVFDPNKSGTLTDREMQEVMMKTQLDKKTCAAVWDLSNPQRESEFSRSMFLIAMHLMYKKRQDPGI